jgi:hypothetical protein
MEQVSTFNTFYSSLYGMVLWHINYFPHMVYDNLMSFSNESSPQVPTAHKGYDEFFKVPKNVVSLSHSMQLLRSLHLHYTARPNKSENVK